MSMLGIRKISSKGQVTLPKEIRDALHTDVVAFEMDGSKVFLKPVEDVGGALKDYAEGYVPLETVREKVWREVTDEKESDTSS